MLAGGAHYNLGLWDCTKASARLLTGTHCAKGCTKQKVYGFLPAPPPSHGQECKEPVVALCGGNKNDTCNLNKIVLCLSQGKFLEDEHKQ